MMNEWIISSSLLIAALLLGRRLMRGKISLRLQYALWGLVLLRLLLPVQLFTSDFGAGTIARDVDISAPVRQVYFSANENRYEAAYDEAYRQIAAEYTAQSRPITPDTIEKEADAIVRQAQRLDLNQLLLRIWLGGMAAMTAVIVSCNVHLSQKLRRRRWEYPENSCLLPVYVTEAVPTPCIFGLFAPVIYLTPDAVRDPTVRGHVLAHELTHYRHLDHIWSVLRTVCLVLHWYNPLVWVAVKASKADAELACDEGVLARLGESQRGDYGRTLIGLTCAAPNGDFLLTATTMTGSAGTIRQRIRLLMKRPRNTLLTLTALILMVTLIVGCTFSTAPGTTTPATEPSEPAESTEPAETQPNRGDPEMIAFFQSLLEPYQSWYSQALTTYYDSPAEIDLFQLFYNGIPGVDNPLSEAERTFLQNQPGYNPDFDLIRIPGQEMERVLNEHFGIDMADTAQIGLTNFIYDPATDCYYHCHTDTNASRPTVTAAHERSDGTWMVFYTDGFLGDGVVILCAQAETWQIVSHHPANYVEVYYAMPMEQAMEDYADRNPRELTEKELKKFRTAFTAWLDMDEGIANPAACFLTCYYSEIYEMDGNEFLAYFPTDQEGTQEEFELLKQKYPASFEEWTWETMPLPIHRYSAKEIEAVVSRYANIHWPELDEGVHYLEETGCYYNYTSDFGLGGFYAQGGFVYDGGAIVYSGSSALFFTETAGSYTIQAHLPVILAE